MKIRTGFVSNSSSTAFIITNMSDSVKTIVDFVNETPWLIENFVEEYGQCECCSQGHLLVSAEEVLLTRPEERTWEPGESKYTIFGDEDGTLIGSVYDYILRDGGNSESFIWRYEEALR